MGMPHLDSNDPASFGWHDPPTAVVPFVYAGHSFPQGLHPLAVDVFTEALDRICHQPGFQLHTGSGLGDGMWGYESRNVVGGSKSRSFHAYAIALDVNAPWNGYGQSRPPDTPWRMPADTSALVEPLGLLWGGGPRWGAHRDWMHLELHLSPAELQPAPPPAKGKPAWRLGAGWSYGERSVGRVATTGPASSPADLAIVRWAQSRVGTPPDGFYGPRTAMAVRYYQAGHGLVADGLLGPRTYARL